MKNAHRLRMSKQSGEVFRALSNLRWGIGFRRRHSQVDGWPTSLELSVQEGDKVLVNAVAHATAKHQQIELLL